MRMKLVDYIPRIKGNGIARFNKRAFNQGHGETFFSAFDKAYWLNPIEVPKPLVVSYGKRRNH